MGLLEDHPWVKEHIDLYKSDPERAHFHPIPGAGEMPTLLLTTRGRRTGNPRDVPLIYGNHAGSFVVIASLAGAPINPSWFKNLEVTPEAEVQVGREHFNVRARMAEGAERAAAWEMVVKIYPTYVEYERMTKGIREIPVIILEPSLR